MTQQKTVKLNRQQKFENATIYALITWFFFWKSLLWYCRGFMIRWQKRRELPGFPVALVVAGSDPLVCLDVLASYGVYAAPASIGWAVVWDEVRLSLAILVSKSQWEYADNVLYQTGCAAYLVATKAGSKRGQALPRPYTQRRKRIPEAQKTKLGKTYR